MTGEALDAYLASNGLTETRLASTGFDGAAVEELLHAHTTSSAVELLLEPVPGSIGKRLAALHWLHSLQAGRSHRHSPKASAPPPVAAAPS